MTKKEYKTVVKRPQIAGNENGHPYLMGYWIVTLIYDSPEKDCQIGERRFFKDLKEPQRLKHW